MPVFEAISNSLHAVQEQFGEDAPRLGEIEIEAFRATTGSSKGQVVGFQIKDNGVGLNEANYESFLRPDSQYKLSRGGKGIGRLGWLKVFGDIKIDSAYVQNSKVAARSFDFILAAENQIKITSRPFDLQSTGTIVRLSNFDSLYGNKCPTHYETIVEKIIGHFLQVFAAGSAPLVSYLDGEEYLDLRQYFKEQIVERQLQDVSVELDENTSIVIQLQHLKAKKAIRADKSKYNWLFLSANERVVEDIPIDEQLGLKLLDGEYVYLGCASGEYFDLHVNQERTGFTLDDNDRTAIRRALGKASKEFLRDHISKVMAAKQRVAQDVISENPQFLYIKGEIEPFVEGLPANALTKEDILIEMSRHRYRRQRDFKGVEREIHKSEVYTAAIAEKVEDYKQFVQDEQKGALAEYVLKRKSVLDLLDVFLGYRDDESERHHLEAAVHSLICPMRVDSASLEISEHNLWIADDRLAFFSFFASDKSFRSYTEDDSLERPDLAFFYDTCFAWRETENNPNTVVLVEFKRPGREDYNGNENPLDQVLDYVERFKSSGSMRDSRGHVLNPNIKSSAFHCYIIADLTDGLRKKLRGFGETTPDGDGLFGYTSNPRVYFEVIPYAKLIRDGRMRNAMFFQKLGLNDHGSAAP